MFRKPNFSPAFGKPGLTIWSGQSLTTLLFNLDFCAQAIKLEGISRSYIDILVNKSLCVLRER